MEKVNLRPTQTEGAQQIDAILLLSPEVTDSLRRAIRVRKEQFIAEWKQHPLSLQQLHDNANLGRIERTLTKQAEGRVQGVRR